MTASSELNGDEDVEQDLESLVVDCDMVLRRLTEESVHLVDEEDVCDVSASSANVSDTFVGSSCDFEVVGTTEVVVAVEERGDADVVEGHRVNINVKSCVRDGVGGEKDFPIISTVVSCIATLNVLVIWKLL